MKTIVTHIGPDLDAITSVWLIKTFFPQWLEAGFAFVPAGKTLGDKPADDDPDILHVDTGFGKYDHHQTDADTCASLLVYEEIKRARGPDPALERLVRVVNEVDHFREVYFPNPTADFWDISIVSAIDGWRLIFSENPIKIIELGMQALDAIYKTFQNKIWAEKEIRDKSIQFTTRWGKGFGIETTNDEVVHLGQKMGYTIVLRKDPKKGYVRVKSFPRDDIDLTELYERLRKGEPEASWFLHASRHMVLNGSSKNPDMKPSKRSVHEIIEVIKEVCT